MEVESTKEGKCGICKKIHKSRSLIVSNDKFICRNCNRKEKAFSYPKVLGRQGFSLEKALSKTYLIKGYINVNGSRVANISLPGCLAERTVKLVLVEGDSTHRIPNAK